MRKQLQRDGLALPVINPMLIPSHTNMGWYVVNHMFFNLVIISVWGCICAYKLKPFFLAPFCFIAFSSYCILFLSFILLYVCILIRSFSFSFRLSFFLLICVIEILISYFGQRLSVVLYSPQRSLCNSIGGCRAYTYVGYHRKFLAVIAPVQSTSVRYREKVVSKIRKIRVSMTAALAAGPRLKTMTHLLANHRIFLDVFWHDKAFCLLVSNEKLLWAHHHYNQSLITQLTPPAQKRKKRGGWGREEGIRV